MRSLAAGERVRIEVPRTIADGQQLPIPGELTFPVIQERVHEVVTVSDAEIVDAMRLLFERAKTVAEPSGASAFAALLAGKVDAAGLRVGVTISGGNVTAARFAELVGLTLAALAIVLASAALHAGWNALVAGAEDTHATAAVAMLTGVAAFAIPAALTWRVDAARRPVHRRLRRARARLLRPARRRLRPRRLLVRLPGRARLGARARPADLRDRARRAVSPSPRVGVLAVTAGVLLVRGVGTEAVDAASLVLALGVGACIAGYTLVDDHGIRHADRDPVLRDRAPARRRSRTRS